MKKSYLSFISVFALSASFAQTNVSSDLMKKNDERTTSTLVRTTSAKPVLPSTFYEKASYLTEDFEGTFPPAGWTVMSGGSSSVTDPEQEWHQRTIGGYPQNSNAFEGTAPGGCAAILYINSVDQHDEYIYTPQVTLPNGNCRVSFDFATSIFWHAPQLGGTHDNADIQTLVSLDDGSTWEVDILWEEDSIDLLNASYSNDYETYIWKRAYVNLSAFQGQAVNVGWYYNGLDGAPFYLDNVSIEDVPDNEIAVHKAWTGDVAADYDYSMVPEDQVKPMRIGTVVQNLGALSQTFDVSADLNDGAASVYSSTASVTLAVSEIDTVWFDTGYTPSALGTYTVTFDIPADGDNSNNTKTNTLETTSMTYAQDFTIDGIYGFDQDDVVSMGNTFYMENNAVLTAADIKFETGTTEDLYVAINVWSVGTDIQDLTQVGIEDYTIPASAIGNGGFTTVAFQSPITLNAGTTYVLEVRKVDNSTDRLYLGGSDAGDDDFSTVCYGPFGTGGAENTWISWGFSPAIRMNFAPAGLFEVSNTVDMSVFPNPAGNKTTVSFELNNTADVNITVTDLAGRTVYTDDLGSIESGSSQFVINTSDLTNGIYSVNVSVNGVISTEKLVVKK